MSLAYVNNEFPGLTHTFIYREVLELRRKGYEVNVYSLRRPDSILSAESLEFLQTTYYLLPVDICKLFQCHLLFLFRSPLRYFSTLFKMLSGAHRLLIDYWRSLMHFGEGVVLAEKMNKDNITHIHAHYASHPTSVARVIHLLLDIPYSFTGHAHDIWHDQLLLPEKLNEATFVVSCSQFGRQSLIEQARQDISSKVHLVYHGLDVRAFIPPEDDTRRKRNLLLAIGRLTEQKGFPDLIDACAILRNSGFSFECIIIGDGEQRTHLEGLIEKRGLVDYIQLGGPVRQEEILQFYHTAWVFVLPCVDTHDGNRDGLPNVIMEAMASGLPVVTTTNSAQTELIRHEENGLLVAPHSPSQLATEIRRLCVDGELRKRIQTSAREKIEADFDSRITILPLLDLFEKFVLSAQA